MRTTKKFDTYFTNENPLPAEATKESPPEEVVQEPEGNKEMEE